MSKRFLLRSAPEINGEPISRGGHRAVDSTTFEPLPRTFRSVREAKAFVDGLNIAHEMMMKSPILIKATFVEYGHQVDIFWNGKEAFSECRDYGGNHRIKKLEEEFIAKFIKLVEEFRKSK